MIAQKSNYFLISFVLCLWLFAWMAVNICLPLLPQLGKLFHVTAGSMRFSIVIYLFFYGVSQLVWGPLSDRFGRKPIFVVGLLLCSAGGFATAFTHHFTSYVIARSVDACGASCCSGVVRTVLSDRFNRKQLTAIFPLGSFAVGIAPWVAVFVASHLSTWFDWQAVYVFLGALAFTLSMVALFGLPETNDHKTKRISLWRTVKTYGKLLKHRKFMSALMFFAFSFGGMVGYYALSPFIFIQEFGLTKSQYSHFILLTVVVYVIATNLTRLLAKVMDLVYVKLIAIIVMGCGFLVFLLLYCFGFDLTLYTLFAGMLLYAFGAGLMSPASNAVALTIITENRGFAGAIIGMSMTLMSALLTAIVSHIQATTLLPLVILIGFVAIGSAVNYVIYRY